VALDIFKRNQLNVNSLLVYNMLIEIYESIGDLVKMNEAKYEKRCFQEEKKISKDVIPYTPHPKK